ncbi:MAG: DUF3299 domain-containing protein [Pirellulales bacterium]|nr:DUF3299 domain-containing protein [Pirellulales bacterium]
MMRCMAVGGTWNAEGEVYLLLACALLIAAAGCTDRASPAASRSTSNSSVESTSFGNSAPLRLASAQATTAAESTPTPNVVNADPEPLAEPGRLRDVTFDTIKFDMKKEDKFVRTMLTPTIEKLFGARIRIRGYILPGFQQTGITKFVLVRDNMECCFGPGAALFDCIVVEMSPGKTANFSTRPVAVEGIFSMDEVKYPDDVDRHIAIYHLVADRVQ